MDRRLILALALFILAAVIAGVLVAVAIDTATTPGNGAVFSAAPGQSL